MSLYTKKFEEEILSKRIIDIEDRIVKAGSYVKGGFKLSFYSGLKMYDLVGLRIDRCQAI